MHDTTTHYGKGRHDSNEVFPHDISPMVKVHFAIAGTPENRVNGVSADLFYLDPWSFRIFKPA
jgi:hypothetical protein